MMKNVLAGLAMMVALPVAAHELPCGQTVAVREALLGKYRETPRFRGVTEAGEMFEVWSADGEATWTLLLTTKDGRSCIAAFGPVHVVLPMGEPT
jgi:hypothetical protein